MYIYIYSVICLCCTTTHSPVACAPLFRPAVAIHAPTVVTLLWSLPIRMYARERMCIISLPVVVLCHMCMCACVRCCCQDECVVTIGFVHRVYHTTLVVVIIFIEYVSDDEFVMAYDDGNRVKTVPCLIILYRRRSHVLRRYLYDRARV